MDDEGIENPKPVAENQRQHRQSQRVLKRHVELAEAVLGAIALVLLALGSACLSYHYTEPGIELIVSSFVAVGLSLHIWIRHRFRGKQKLRLGPLAIGGIVGVTLIARATLAFFGRPIAQPFRVELRAAAIHDASGPLALFMVGYQSMYGPTASPVVYLINLQLANLQDVSSTIVSYSLRISRESNGPWEKLVPISLDGNSLYATGVRTEGQARVGFPRGAYRLATPMTAEDMMYAALLIPNPTFDSQLANALPPHGTINGWAAFDSTTRESGRVRDYFQITVRDSANVENTTVAKLYRSEPDDRYVVDPQIGIIVKAGPVIDISGFHVRYFSDPYP